MVSMKPAQRCVGKISLHDMHINPVIPTIIRGTRPRFDYWLIRLNVLQAHCQKRIDLADRMSSLDLVQVPNGLQNCRSYHNSSTTSPPLSLAKLVKPSSYYMANV